MSSRWDKNTWELNHENQLHSNHQPARSVRGVVRLPKPYGQMVMQADERLEVASQLAR